MLSSKELIQNYSGLKIKNKPTQWTLKMPKGHPIYANSLCRVICGELDAKHLTFQDKNFKTDDKYILIEFIRNNIELCPLAQNVDKDTKFELNVTNPSNDPISVYMKDLKPHAPVNDDIEICELSPGKRLNIKLDITVKNGMIHAAGTRAFAGRAINGEIIFETNGIDSGKNIVRAGIAALMNRIKTLIDLIPFWTTSKGTNILQIPGENDSLGMIFAHGVHTVYQNIPFVSANTDHEREMLILKLRLTDGHTMQSVISNVVKYLTDYYAEIVNKI